MKVIYPGPSLAVEVSGIIAHKGVPVEVPDHIGRSLIEQGWTKPAKPRKTKE